MARIELRDCIIFIQDGLSGSALIAESTPNVADTDADINTVNLNTTDIDLVPVGARFTINTANNVTTYAVIGRTGICETQSINIDDASSNGTFTLTYEDEETANIAYDANMATVEAALVALSTIGANNVAVTGGPGPTTDWVAEFINDECSQDCELMVGDGSLLVGGGTNVTITETLKGAIGPTTNIEFTPPWGTYVPSQGDGITFISQRIEIKIGEGNLTWTEAKEYEYLLERGDLDTVREGDEQPLEVSLEFIYDYITTQSGKDITPVDALKQANEASEWVSSATEDLCEPYAIDMIVFHCLPCGTDQDERVTLSDFRYESLEYDLGEATIAVSGRCNVSEATVNRSASFDECA